MSLSSFDCFLTRRNARTTEGFPKASSNSIAPAHVIRDLHQALHLSFRRCLIFLVCPLCANPQCMIRVAGMPLASCHVQTSRSSSRGETMASIFFKLGRVALVRRIVSLRALAAFIVTHLGAELVERHGAEHRDPLAGASWTAPTRCPYLVSGSPQAATRYLSSARWTRPV